MSDVSLHHQARAAGDPDLAGSSRAGVRADAANPRRRLGRAGWDGGCSLDPVSAVGGPRHGSAGIYPVSRQLGLGMPAVGFRHLEVMRVPRDDRDPGASCPISLEIASPSAAQRRGSLSAGGCRCRCWSDAPGFHQRGVGGAVIRAIQYVPIWEDPIRNLSMAFLQRRRIPLCRGQHAHDAVGDAGGDAGGLHPHRPRRGVVEKLMSTGMR